MLIKYYLPHTFPFIERIVTLFGSPTTVTLLIAQCVTNTSRTSDANTVVCRQSGNRHLSTLLAGLPDEIRENAQIKHKLSRDADPVLLMLITCCTPCVKKQYSGFTVRLPRVTSGPMIILGDTTYPHRDAQSIDKLIICY